MSDKNFFKRIVQRISIRKRPARADTASASDKAMLEKLLRMVDDTDEVELSCDDVFDLLDQYVELEAQGADVAHLLPMVKKHLERCRDCFEEYEALTRMAAASLS